MTYMATVPTPKRGEVWLVRFDPSAGAEIRKVRPTVVVNLDASAASPYESWFRSRIGRATSGISPGSSSSRRRPRFDLHGEQLFQRRHGKNNFYSLTGQGEELARVMKGVIG